MLLENVQETFENMKTLRHHTLSGQLTIVIFEQCLYCRDQSTAHQPCLAETVVKIDRNI